MDRRIRGRLPPDMGGQFAGLILVGGTDHEELPPPDDRPPFAAKPGRQRHRLLMGGELGPHLPLRHAGGQGFLGLIIQQPLMLGLALGPAPRQRDVWVFPAFLNGMPAVDGEPGLEAMFSEQVAGDPRRSPRGWARRLSQAPRCNAAFPMLVPGPPSWQGQMSPVWIGQPVADVDDAGNVPDRVQQVLRGRQVFHLPGDRHYPGGHLDLEGG